MVRRWKSIFVCDVCFRDDIGYVVTFQMFDKRRVDWSNSQRFMKGSLLCLSSNGSFNKSTLVMATVLRGVIAPKQGKYKHSEHQCYDFHYTSALYFYFILFYLYLFFSSSFFYRRVNLWMGAIYHHRYRRLQQIRH